MVPDAASLKLVRQPGDVVIVANRLPVTWSPTDGWIRSPGGLVTALEAVVRRRSVEWYGSLAALGHDGSVPTWTHGALQPVAIDADLAAHAVGGMANSTLWPALHGIRERVRWRAAWWDGYVDFNRRFARRVADSAAPDAVVWVHDYHLLLVPSLLAEMRGDVRVGLSVHTPIDAGALLELPVADELVAALDAAALIGVQTERDAHQLVDLVGSRIEDRVEVSPVSVDVHALAMAHRDPTARLLAERWRGRQLSGRRRRSLVVGVDRMDYTKCIPQRLLGIDLAFRRGWLDPDGVDIIQIAQPSRASLPAYRDVRLEIERLAHEISSRWERADHTSPLTLVTDAVDRRVVLALLGAADIALVTPVRDGMNLVAKEFSVVNEEHGGVLVLSEGAGAAAELGAHSVQVDGGNHADVASGIDQAVRLDPVTRRRWATQRAMAVRQWTASDWASSFCDRLGRAPIAAT